MELHSDRRVVSADLHGKHRARPINEPGDRCNPAPSRLPGVWRKQLENPERPKPTYGSDEELAALLEALLRRVPCRLEGDVRSPTPLLDALAVFDRDAARQLIFIAAANHRTADERRTAEYLLRHREAVDRCSRPARSLLCAARYAAEMDVRRVQLREVPVPREALARHGAERPVARSDGPSVSELVLTTLVLATGHGPSTTSCRRWIADAVAIALALGERHGLNRGRGPSLLAMRADARKNSRLVTHLRRELGDEAAPARIARLLVGPDGTPIESALLWWSARANRTSPAVPIDIRSRWLRDLRAVDAAARTVVAPALRLVRSEAC